MWTCDRKRVYRNSGEGSRKASGRSQMGLVGLSGLRTTSGAGPDDLQVTKRRVLFPREASALRRRGDERAFFNCGSAQSAANRREVGRKRMLQTLSSLQCNSQRPALHQVRSSAYQALPIYPMAMRKKGKKVHADYDNFLLGCDFSSS